MKLLYAEDERAMSEAVVDILTYHKYSVDAVYDGEDALAYAENGDYDGIILDVMMPKRDGLSVLKALRAEGIFTPVLLLTAKGQVEDRIEGLDAGADDYLPKPFAMGELLARVRALLRRSEQYTPDLLSVGNSTLDRGSCRLSVGGEGVLLSALEYKMLEALFLSRGRCLSTEDLLCKVWGYETENDHGIVWVYISYLRRRLSSVGSNVEIRAKRGVGYYLEVCDD